MQRMRTAGLAAVLMAATAGGGPGEAAPTGDVPAGNAPPRPWRKAKKPYVRKTPTTAGDAERLAKAQAKRERKAAIRRAAFLADLGLCD